MTEKTVLQQISNLVFDIQHTDDLQEAFDKAGEILKLTESDHQPAFAVGEYYVILNVIYKVTEIVGDTVKILSLHPATGELCKEDFKLSTATEHTDKPATAEQIATFRRAEHFASKGRKLGEFRVGDLVLIGGDKVCVKNISPDDWLTAVNKNGGYKMRKNDSHRITLIQTAEELQEVADGKNRKN